MLCETYTIYALFNCETDLLGDLTHNLQELKENNFLLVTHEPRQEKKIKMEHPLVVKFFFFAISMFIGFRDM